MLTLPSWTADLLDSDDDQGVCDFLLTLLRTGDDSEQAMKTLYEPWVLQRLRLIKRRAAHVYFGSFIGPLRRLFPGHVFPSELLEAMQGTDAFQDGTLGDVEAQTWHKEAVRFFHEGATPGFWPGWTNLAEYYTVVPGDLTIVTGVSNHMKSSFVHGLCVNLARAHRWHIGMYAAEHPLDHLGAELVQHKAGHLLTGMPEEEYLDTLDWVTEHFHCIEPPEEVPPTLSYLLAVARLQVERYKIQGLVLDPWNEIEHQYYGRQSETQYISEALSRLRRFARHYRVHVWVVAHPTKIHKAESGPYAGKYPPPKPYDISGSANWYNKADSCLSIWRDVDEDSPRIEVHIQKVRWRTAGKPGVVELEYHEGRFVEDVVEETTWHH